jgi:hypothetical protein
VPGYSGRSLVEKLGVRAGHRVALLHAPPAFADALAPLPDDVVLTDAASGATAVVLLFSRESARLAAEFPRVAAVLPTGGMLWVAWPKKASRQPTDLTEDVVRGIGLAAGLVDVKVCAVDDVWSGLKFLRRRAAAAPAR